MNENPELMALVRIRWDVFGTLTYRRANMREELRRSVWCTMLRYLGGRCGVRFNRLLWVFRQEKGEQFGRIHNHCLIGGLPSERVNLGLCFSLASAWNALRGGGFAQFRLYDRGLAGAEYITKGLGIKSPADFHEGQKFGAKSSSLTLSRSLARVLVVGAGKAMMRDRTAGPADAR